MPVWVCLPIKVDELAPPMTMGAELSERSGLSDLLVDRIDRRLGQRVHFSLGHKVPIGVISLIL